MTHQEAQNLELAIATLFHAVEHLQSTHNSRDNRNAKAQRLLIEKITELQFSRVPFWQVR